MKNWRKNIYRQSSGVPISNFVRYIEFLKKKQSTKWSINNPLLVIRGEDWQFRFSKSDIRQLNGGKTENIVKKQGTKWSINNPLLVIRG